ncbi:transmembrane channel-like protein 7 [Eucyclogobius newberryi]|uniref:transmembrane channel-like protein 7 n=1 Tax=Eucyclogobius newberryi TaxID=166745 RepID=UPI003B58D135
MQDSISNHSQGRGPRSGPQSLRLRQAPSRSSSRNYPHLDRSSDVDEENQDDPVARDLRTIPLPMALKRAVRQAQQMQTPVAPGDESWKKKKNKSWLKVKSVATEILHFFTLWRKSIQNIGGNFGGGVQSYFLFLRFLVILNFFSFLLIGGFVIIPSIIFRAVEGSSTDSTGPEECMTYDPNPQGLVVFYTFFLNFLSGTGFIEYTYLFYGYYNNTLVENMTFSYNIPLAYLSTAAFYLLFCLFCIIARMGTTARVAVATGGSSEGSYSVLVFTGWDYGSSGQQATKLKQQNVYFRLQVDLEEELIKKKSASLTQCQKVCLYSTRIVLFILALGFIGAAITGIFFATNFSQQNSDQAGILGLFYEYLPSIVITVANFVVPTLNDQIAPFERYSPSVTVVLALVRAVLLRLVSLVILLFTLWRQITCEQDKADCELCHYNVKAYQCWETRVGQEMYKLTLFDLIINLAVLILVEFPRRIFVDNWPNKLTRWVGRQEFVVPYNVLGLVYGQTVVWTGAFFCPLLPLINTLKFIVLFYTKKITLFQNCRPALKTFRSTTSSFFFSGILLLGLGLASLVMIYSAAVIHPSMACGPFRLLTNMWGVVPASISKLSQTTREFLFFVGSQSFSIPLFALSCLVLCYIVALATVYKKSVTLLRTQLKLESQDKQFLVKQIGRLSRI